MIDKQLLRTIAYCKRVSPRAYLSLREVKKTVAQLVKRPLNQSKGQILAFYGIKLPNKYSTKMVNIGKDSDEIRTGALEKFTLHFPLAACVGASLSICIEMVSLLIDGKIYLLLISSTTKYEYFVNQSQSSTR